MNKRNLILAAVMVVAVVIGYVAISGKYPPKDGTQGAIGAANRYQAQQITGSDVSLKDAKIQAFLQTDVFHKVATNAKFRAAVTNPKFQAIAKSQSFQNLSSDPGFAEYLGKYKELLERADFDAMLSSKKLQNVAEMEKLLHLLKDKHFQNLASDQDFVALLKDPAFDVMMEQAEAQKATTVKEIKNIAEMEKNKSLQNVVEMEKRKDKDFILLLSSDVLQEAASQGELQNIAELLESTDVETMFSDASFQELLANPKALAFITSDEMSSIAEMLETMSRQGSSAELLSVLSDPGVVDAFQHVEMQEMANADLLESAVAAVEQ